MKADGTVVMGLTFNAPIYVVPESETPAWSPDGKQIAFVVYGGGDDHRAVYRMKADGSVITKVTPDGYYAYGISWSPDGKQIAFTGRDNEDHEGVFVLSPNGTEVTALTYMSGIQCQRAGLDWSLDGTKIAFDSGNRVYVIALERLDARYLKGTASDETGRPSWSPDGKTILSSIWNDGSTRYIKIKANGGTSGDGSQYRKVRDVSLGASDADWGPKIW